MAVTRALSLRDFSGGLNTSYERWQIADNEIPYVRNMVITKRGSIASAKGFVSSGSQASSSILGLFPFYLTATTYLIRCYGTQVEYSTNPVAASPTWTNIETLATGNAKMNAVEYNNSIWYGNAVDNFRSWDGAAVTQYAGAPKCNIFAVWRATCWAAGNTTNPSTLYYSDTDAFQTWAGGTAGSLTVNLKDGQAITGIVALKDSLIVYKERSVYEITYEFDQVTSTAYYKVTPLSKKYGCIAPRTAVELDNDSVALSHFGVLTAGEVGTYTSLRNMTLSDKIRQDVKSSNFGGAVSATYANLSSAGYFEGQLYLSIPTGSSINPDSMYLYDSLYKAWTFLYGIGANVFVTYRNAYMEDYLFFGSSDGYVYYFTENNSFNLIDFQKIFQTKTLDFGSAVIKKELSYVTITGSKAQGSTIAGKWYRDFDYESFEITDDNLIENSAGGYVGEDYYGAEYFGSTGSSTGVDRLRFQKVFFPDERGFSQTFVELSNDQADEPFDIDSITFYFTDLDIQETAETYK